jgi:hypothetical protein
MSKSAWFPSRFLALVRRSGIPRATTTIQQYLALFLGLDAEDSSCRKCVHPEQSSSPVHMPDRPKCRATTDRHHVPHPSRRKQTRGHPIRFHPWGSRQGQQVPDNSNRFLRSSCRFSPCPNDRNVVASRPSASRRQRLMTGIPKFAHAIWQTQASSAAVPAGLNGCSPRPETEPAKASGSGGCRPRP